MHVLLVILAVFGVVQLVWSTRYAYCLQRYELAAGYPILGHALHTFIVLVLICVLMPKSWSGSWTARAMGVATLVLPVLHGWMLIKFDRLGEKHRSIANGGG